MQGPDLIIRKTSGALVRLGHGCLRLSSCLDNYNWIPREEKQILRRNAQLRDMYAGRRAFVLGNGPSLNKLRLKLLKEELAFAVNNFASHPILDCWQPVCLAMFDPLYFQHVEIYKNQFLLSRTKLPTCRFFVPLEWRDVILRNGLLPEERTFFLRCCGSLAHHPNARIDFARPLPLGRTVTINAVLTALFMGCDPIYLIGMDHDFLAAPKQASHFSGDYDAAIKGTLVEKQSASNWAYLDLITAVKAMWEGYVNLGKYAQREGRRIYNATAGGFLDVFPRVEFESLFQHK